MSAALFAGELGLAPTAGEAPVAALVTPEQTAALESACWLLRARSLQEARLIVSLAAPRSPATPAMLQALADVATLIVELDLSAAGFWRAARLASARQRRGPDAALAELAPLQQLHTLHAWGTGITTEGAAALAATRPGLRVEGLGVTP